VLERGLTDRAVAWLDAMSPTTDCISNVVVAAAGGVISGVVSAEHGPHDIVDHQILCVTNECHGVSI